jgi:hypothetical protein
MNNKPQPLQEPNELEFISRYIETEKRLLKGVEDKIQNLMTKKRSLMKSIDEAERHKSRLSFSDVRKV